MPRKKINNTVAEGCFNIDEEMKWYSDYYNAASTPLMERDIRACDNENEPQPVVKMSEAGESLSEYPSIKQAAKENKLSSKAITYVLKGKKKEAGGYVWSYKQ